MTEEDWDAAYRAAEYELRLCLANGGVTNESVRRVAIRVATAVIRSPIEDVSTLPGVTVDRIQ
jgi:hypothetical protein